MSDNFRSIYLEDLAEAIRATLEKMVDVADKHNVDRNKAMQHFATVFSAIVKTSTFEDYKTEKKEEKK